MPTTTQLEHDVAELTQLDADYLAADQNMDIARYQEILAADFTATLQVVRRKG
jgi:hypothetical protein